MESKFRLALKNMRERWSQTALSFLPMLLILGVPFIVGGIVLFRQSSIDSDWTRMEGTVVNATKTYGNADTDYLPIVRYTVNNETYTVRKTSSEDTLPAVGSKREVVYNPDNPVEAKVVQDGYEKFFYTLPISIGVVLFALILLLIAKTFRRSLAIVDLKQNGQKTRGILTEIPTRAGPASSTSSYKLIVSATSPEGSVQTYESEWLKGSGFIGLRHYQTKPMTFDVYIDPTNQEKYYVDTSGIPKLTPGQIANTVMETDTER
jgi:hypothetical protein